MRWFSSFGLLLIALTLCAAKPVWQFPFLPAEKDQAFWAEFQQKVVGTAPAVDFEINLVITSREQKDGYTFCTVEYNVEKDI